MASNKWTLLEAALVFCIVLFAGVVRIPSLLQPIGPDQGIMSVIGEGVLNGGVPYRDYFEMASPAIFFTYALMFKIFGPIMAAIPLTDMLVSMLTTFFVFILARAVWGSKVGYVSALVFAFFSSGVRFGMHANGDIAFGTFWYLAQRETFMISLLTASFYFVLDREKDGMKFWRLVLSGFLAGLAFVYKFPAMLFFLCLLVYINAGHFFDGERKPFKSLLADNAALIAGFVVSIIPFVLFFIMKGAMEDMIDIIFKYVYSVYGQLEHSSIGILKVGLTHTIFIAVENFILWIFFITSSIYIIANKRSKDNLLMVLWALAAVMYVISHKEFFGYHYLIILPPFSILTGYGIVKALGTGYDRRYSFSGASGKAVVVFAILINLIVFTALVHMHYTKFYFYATDKISKETYYDFFDAYPKHDYSFSADYKVARYILDHTNKDDMIFTLGGIESAIHFITKRKSPSRFVYSWILFSYDHSKAKEAEGFREELLGDLKAKTPKYIITVRSLDTFRKYTNIYDFVHNNYLLEKTFPDDRFVYVYNGKGDNDYDIGPRSTRVTHSALNEKLK